jgi:hypothetical protein
MTHPGASTTDAYATRTELPQVDDPELEKLISEWLERHPGAQRSQAMDAVLHGLADASHAEVQQMKRDATAKRCLEEALASIIAHAGEDMVAKLDESIGQFNEWVVKGDMDGTVEVRKAA